MGRSVELLAFSHIGLCVHSIDDFKRTWDPLLGGPAWFDTEVEAPAGRSQLFGEVLDANASRLSFARFAGTAFELIEPRRGRTHAADRLQHHGEGLHHLGFWVADLGAELDKLDTTDVEVAYSPTSLRTDLAGRPLAAAVSGQLAGLDGDQRPPFFAYIDSSPVHTWTLELLDARFADTYRCLYGDNVMFPSDPACPE